jgi:apolipoprotein N-acyltransferase
VTAVEPKPGAIRDSRILAAGLTAKEASMHELMPLLEEDPAEFRARTAEIRGEYLQMSRAAAEEGVDLLVWPELAGTGTFADVALLLEEAAALADTYDLHLAVSTMEIDPDGERTPVNQISLIGPDGSLLGRHVKFGGNFMEGTLAGEQDITMVDTALGRVGLAICWDFDFHRIVATAGRDSADLLIVPAADWSGIDPLHGRMAVFRSIENGTTLVRQAQNGLSIIADPYGRVIDTGSGPANAVRAIVSVGSVETLYPEITNVVGILSTLAALAAAAIAFLRWRTVSGGRNAQAA